MSLQYGWKICILHRVHTPKVGFYLVNFFLLFSNKSQKDPTFGYYNLANSDVRVFHSLNQKLERLYELQQVMLH